MKNCITENCLEWNLNFWNKNREYKLFYNSNHVIAIEKENASTLPLTYLPLEDFGIGYFINAFSLKGEYVTVLKDYIKSLDAVDYGF